MAQQHQQPQKSPVGLWNPGLLESRLFHRLHRHRVAPEILHRQGLRGRQNRQHQQRQEAPANHRLHPHHLDTGLEYLLRPEHRQHQQHPQGQEGLERRRRHPDHQDLGRLAQEAL